MKNPTFSILKGLAIMLVVLSHAAPPSGIANIIYQFHVAAFFICMGYFFKTSYLNAEKTYIVRRFKSLYIPFLKYALFFLVCHNLFYLSGIINSEFGNGGQLTAHWYTWHNFCQRLWNIVTNMSGYDEFLAGSYWFFRALLVSSILYLIAFKLLNKIKRLENQHILINVCITLLFLLLAVWKSNENIKVIALAPGGSREIIGVSLIAIGFMYRKVLEKNLPVYARYAACLISLIIVVGLPQWINTNMAFFPKVPQILTLPIAAIAGFILLHALSSVIEQYTPWLKARITYIGEHTLSIFAFHLLAFKVVSAFKVLCYGLPWLMVGGHTVVHAHNDDAFYILYVIAGVGLPLLTQYYFRCIRAKYRLTPIKCLQLIIQALRHILNISIKILKYLYHAILKYIKSIIRDFKEILSAGNPKEE
jgi:fucose 4-O-acetylase-like acetyltransferase